MITVFSDNKEIPVNKVEFSDGAITYKLDQLQPDAKYISVNVGPSTKVNLVREELLMVVECLYELTQIGHFNNNVKLYLNLPYLPYARADRVFEKGNPHGLKSFLYSVVDLGFDEINICDIHNMNAIKEFENFMNVNLKIKEKPQLQCFKESFTFDHKKDWQVVVAPDKGAVDKAKTIAEYLGVECVFANKVRDVSTGKLTEMNLPDYDFTGKKVLIPDDIGDKMGTHIWLAQKLKEAGASQVDLYVTHLIAPTGLKHLTGIIDNVYCYQTVAGYINKQTVTDFNLGKI
jgi:ribose-phosphate pyrophosphokinase